MGNQSILSSYSIGNMMSEKEKSTQEEKKLIRFRWASPDEIPAIYANQLFISHAEDDEFHLVFGHMAPPSADSERPDEVTIQPVAKIKISPEAMKSIAHAITEASTEAGKRKIIRDSDQSASVSYRIKSDAHQMTLASEAVLSRDWDTAEEDEAWAHL